GRSSRAGYPCSGRIASPFCPYAINASSYAFAMGMLRVITAASCPSARNHVAFGLAPTSRNSVASGTPVHSLVLVMPASCCAVMPLEVQVRRRDGAEQILVRRDRGIGAARLSLRLFGWRPLTECSARFPAHLGRVRWCGRRLHRRVLAERDGGGGGGEQIASR